MVLLLLVMGGASLLKMREVEATIDNIAVNRYDKIRRLVELKDSLNLIVRSGRNALLVPDAAEVDKLLKQMVDTQHGMDLAAQKALLPPH